MSVAPQRRSAAERGGAAASGECDRAEIARPTALLSAPAREVGAILVARGNGLTLEHALMSMKCAMSRNPAWQTASRMLAHRLPCEPPESGGDRVDAVLDNEDEDCD